MEWISEPTVGRVGYVVASMSDFATSNRSSFSHSSASFSLWRAGRRARQCSKMSAGSTVP